MGKGKTPPLISTGKEGPPAPILCPTANQWFMHLPMRVGQLVLIHREEQMANMYGPFTKILTFIWATPKGNIIKN